MCLLLLQLFAILPVTPAKPNFFSHPSAHKRDYVNAYTEKRHLPSPYSKCNETVFNQQLLDWEYLKTQKAQEIKFGRDLTFYSF